MSHDRTGLYFPDFALDSTKASPSLFAGLFQDMVEKVGDDPVKGDAGFLHYFNHMLQWEGPVTEASAGGWTLTDVVGTSTITLSDVRFGEIVITPDATANADPCLQLGSTTHPAPFLYSVGKRMWCAARVSFLTVASMEIFLGFGTPDTQPTPANTLPSNMIGFQKTAAAGGALSFSAGAGGTQTTKTGPTIADATYTTIGFQVDKLGNCLAYQDGAVIPASLIAVGDANLPTSGAAVMQFMLGTRGASQTTKIDWLMIAQEI